MERTKADKRRLDAEKRAMAYAHTRMAAYPDLEEREDVPDDGDTVTREDFAVLLRTFPDDLIAEELARRGFHGRLTGENGTIQLTDEGSSEECDLTNADLVRILRERGCRVTATQPITVYQQL